MRKYCSRICDFNDGYVAKNCEKCNVHFTCIKGFNKRRFCSQKCGNSMKNYIKDRSKVSDVKGRRTHAYRLWRLSVLARDKNICRISNIDCAGRLEVHYILPWSKFPELHNDINNGITLCQFHHPRNPKDEIKLSPYFQQLVAKMN